MNKLTIKQTSLKLNIKQVGSPGPKGDDGENGLNGTSATIELGTVVAGDTASITNSGTDNNAVFNFVLPRGEQGEKGENGASSQLENLGDGVEVYKESINDIAYLKTIRGTDTLISINDNTDDNTIDLSVNTRGLNTVIQSALEGVYSDIESINTSIETINSDITSIDTNIESIQGKVLPIGGTIGQVLTKKTGTDFDTEWKTPSAGGGGSDIFNNYTRRRYILSTGNFQNSQISLAISGFSNSNSNYQYNSGIPVSFVAGKSAFYQYSKFTYKDTTAGATAGYYAGSVYADSYNYLGYGDCWFKFGLTSVNDINSAMFIGLSSGNNSTPTTANDIFNNSYGGGAWAIGFGFEDTDTNLQFFFIRSGSYKFKVNFNLFTGNFIASDILARQAETAISYRMTNKIDSSGAVIGIDLFFYNHNTNRGGKYTLLFSVLNQTHIFNKEAVSFSPMYLFFHNPGFSGTKDIFNLFAVDITN